jgi:hypothetical protein
MRKGFVEIISEGIQNCKTEYHFYIIKEQQKHRSFIGTWLRKINQRQN